MRALWLVFLFFLAACGQDRPATTDRVDFNFSVKPILSDRCFPCHGPDENARQTEFRLDTEEGAFIRLSKSRRKFALVPGNLRKSEVFHRVSSDDPDYRMPPPESNLALSAEEAAIIFRWIEQGAEYKRHWSLIPPVKPDLPKVTPADWPKNGIDYFVLRRLSREGLTPSPPATRETLIRRATFDLTGLPPTIEEIDAFLADTSAYAYEKVIDRLLDSPAYGERMATEWLDVARYADSHGYQDDGLRSMWPWRDWVISAFNRNQPFDEFVMWQLAGDLLPDPTIEQRLATGFNRNHLQSQEGGIIPEEYRVDYVADRTNTFGKAFLGLTMECARCHDHKFDPISQQEYYEVFHFFNSVNEFGTSPYSGVASPTVVLINEEAESKLAPLREKIRSLERKTSISNSNFDDGFDRWLALLESDSLNVAPKGLLGYYPLDGFEKTVDDGGVETFHLANLVKSDKRGFFYGDKDKLPVQEAGHVDSSLTLQGDGYLDMGGEIYYFERTDPFSISLWFRVFGDNVSGPLFTKTTGLFNGRQGYLCVLQEDGTVTAGLNHTFPDNSIEIRTRDSIPFGTWNHIVMTYDGSSRAAGLGLYLNGERMPSDITIDNLKQSTLFTINPTTGEPTIPAQAGNLRIGYLGPTSPMLDSVTVDEFRIYDRRLTALEVAALSRHVDALDSILQTPTTERTDTQVEALRDYYVTAVSAEYASDLEALTAVRREENDIVSMLPEVMVMRDMPEPRPTYILDRGQYDAPVRLVSRATPAAVMPFAEGFPSNRRGLAEWLLDSKNPLPARVTVNRYWQMYFGKGLVATPDDFGSQGSLPSHPELLDYLATTFVDMDWDVKEFQKFIVTSSTYRQSSVADPARMAVDADNTLLARGPSYRMPAEMIRDNALAVSGLLVPEIGGPPVKPYQPEGLWKELATRNATEYVQDHGQDLYRRSMYTIWKRTTPPPSMMTFDTPERNTCTVRRQSTSTPLQALVLLNDPQFVEAARVLAERLLKGHENDLEAKLMRGYRLLTSRKPDQDVLHLLARQYQTELESFSTDRESALELLSVGEHKRDESLDVTRLAALTVVTSTIMNFDEAVYKR